jgi:hypothetical protein
MNKYDDILESIDAMSIDEKLYIAEIIKKRAIEQRRLEIKENAEKSLEEYKTGKITPQSVEAFIKEIMS